MQIAQIAPLIEPVPPQCYGGTERVVSWLTEELVRQGHEVVLFASGDSRTAARLVPCCPAALRAARIPKTMPAEVLQLEQVRKRAGEFDVLHFHTDCRHFPLVRELARPALTTLHGRLDRPGLQLLFDEFHDMPLVAVSDSQRRALRAGWIGTVHHGLPAGRFGPAGSGSGGYLAFLGRLSPEKRPDRAIEIAGRAGMELRIAAKVDDRDRAYIDAEIRPLLDLPHVRFVGEIDEEHKKAFLAGASALLFPIDWPEPFGLVMIEAMACGTPVIAWRNGSVPEVVDDGVTGFVVESLDAAVAAVREVRLLDRRAVQDRCRRRFSCERMAREYLALYRACVAAKEPAAGKASTRRNRMSGTVSIPGGALQ